MLNADASGITWFDTARWRLQVLTLYLVYRLPQTSRKQKEWHGRRNKTRKKDADRDGIRTHDLERTAFLMLRFIAA
jgi:hypothetical protein